MALRMKNKINPANQISDFRSQIDQAAGRSREAFFTWFNEGAGADGSFVQGSWDFGIHIAYPLTAYIERPEELTCLELGHGGGRLLSAASRHFAKAVGVDIHDNNDLVMDELRQRGARNVELFSSDGSSIPLPDLSFDVVYSFIVLQHVEKIEVFKAYLRETYRVLRPGGFALLYFGRKAQWSINKEAPMLFRLECLAENLWLPKGFMEIPAEVNHTNLLVTRKFAKKLSRGFGFRFLNYVVSYKGVPGGFGRYGGQHGILLSKPL
jgi:SAM-dependent methyltransferase